MKPRPIWPLLFSLVVVAIDVYALQYNWGWWRYVDRYSGFWETLLLSLLMAFLINGLMFMAAIACGCGLSSMIGSMAEVTWEKAWTTPLASLRNIDSLSGSLSGGMFIMSGHIGASEVYYYYIDRGKGEYAPRQWEVDSDTRVFEEDRKDAEAVCWRRVFKRGEWIGWFGSLTQYSAMDFHIPKGSLVKQYSLK